VAGKDRAMGASRYHHYHRRDLARRRVGPLHVLLFAAVLTGAGVLAVTLFALLALTQGLVLGVGTIVAVHHLRRRRRRAIYRQQPVARPAPVARPEPAPDWRATRTRFARLRSEYGQFECDALAVLRLPALTDVTVPSTGRFVDAFAEAQALDTETEPPAEHRARYATAVDRAWRAWQAARDAAERIRLANIPEQERATVQRAIKLLTMARDSDHDAERSAAYAKARAELAKLDRSGTVRLPPAAAAALDAAARSQLPPGRATV
jgi:hypothetical protein